MCSDSLCARYAGYSSAEESARVIRSGCTVGISTLFRPPQEKNDLPKSTKRFTTTIIFVAINTTLLDFHSFDRKMMLSRRRVLLDAAKRFLSSGSSSSPLSSLSLTLDGQHDDAEFLSSQLHSKGFVPTTSQLLSLETTAMIKDRMNRLFHGQFDTGVYPDEWHWRAGISKPNVTREICNSWKSDTKIANLVLDEKIGGFIASVMGWSSGELVGIFSSLLARNT